MGHGAWGIGYRALLITNYLLPITNYQFSIVPHLSEKGYRREIARELALRIVIPPKIPGQGFQTFGEFKKRMGVAGAGLAWHHIVGQTTSNLQKFGAEAIHNTGNLVRLEHGIGSIHQEITNLYNSF